MGFGTPGGSGSRAGGGGGPTATQWRTILTVAAVAVFAILVRTGRITRFELIYFCTLVPSIILHEISHGWVALACGDDTAKRSGRLTLNPIAHVDVVGTLIVPALLTLAGYGAYGWAKPVPVSVNRLRHPRNQAVLVSIAGPLTNFALAALCGIAFTVVVHGTEARLVALNAAFGGLSTNSELVGQILAIAGFANIILGLFNLIPCPPLDGASLLERLLPARVLPEYYRLMPFLMFLPFLLILVFRNEWASLIGHVVNWWANRLV
jgi:Zn-dependent protease